MPATAVRPALHATRFAEQPVVGGLASRCDWVVRNNEYICKHLDSCTGSPSTIFIKADPGNFVFFYERLLPSLNNSFVLFSGSADNTVPVQIDKRYPPFSPREQEALRGIYDSELVERWAVENLVEPFGDKMVPMPLGFSPGECNHWDPTVPPCRHMWGIIDEAKRAPLAAKPLKMSCRGRLRQDQPQFALREKVHRMCDRGGAWNHLVAAPNGKAYGPRTYARLQGMSAFVLCVSGGGIDPAPKAFEALAAGSIPIIQHSSLDSACARPA